VAELVAVRHNPHFVLLWAGNGLSLIGTSAVRIAYPILALAVVGSPAAAGWMSLVVALPALLLQIPAGVVADAVNRRRTMLACQAVGLLATLGAAAAVATRPPGVFGFLLVTAFVESAAFTFFALAEFAAVRDVVDESQRATAYAFYEAEQPVSTLLGRTLGGGLLSFGGAVPFLANAVSYACCLLALGALPAGPLDAKPREHRGSWASDVAEGFHWVWTVPFIRLAALLTGLTNALFQGVILLVIVVMTDQHRSTWGVGVILAAAGAGGILGSFAVPRLLRVFPAESVYGASLVGWSVALVLIAAFPSPLVLAVAWGAVGGIGAISSVAMNVIRLQMVPEAALGRTMGVISIVTDGAGPLGGVAAGYALAAWGSRPTGWAIAVTMLLVATLGGGLLRSRSRSRAKFGSGSRLGSVLRFSSRTKETLGAEPLPKELDHE
jgi:MFS family permease